MLRRRFRCFRNPPAASLRMVSVDQRKNRVLDGGVAQALLRLCVSPPAAPYRQTGKGFAQRYPALVILSKGMRLRQIHERMKIVSGGPEGGAAPGACPEPCQRSKESAGTSLRLLARMAAPLWTPCVENFWRVMQACRPGPSWCAPWSSSRLPLGRSRCHIFHGLTGVAKPHPLLAKTKLTLST